MSEVVVGGAFTARDGKEFEAQEAFEALVDPTHGDDGCILYALHRGHEDPRRLAFIERWESKEKLDAHLESDHVKDVLTKIDDLVASADITVYDAIPCGRGRKGSLAAHAGG
jgi:quinol monooxygenase YgiN